jgi:hypothetical protein
MTILILNIFISIWKLLFQFQIFLIWILKTYLIWKLKFQIWILILDYQD